MPNKNHRSIGEKRIGWILDRQPAASPRFYAQRFLQVEQECVNNKILLLAGTSPEIVWEHTAVQSKEILFNNSNELRKKYSGISKLKRPPNH